MGNWTRKPLLLTLVAVVLALAAFAVVAGCTPATQPEEPANGENGEETGLESMRLDLVEEWAVSGHASIITNAAAEEGCKNCHDGLTFTTTGGGMQPRMNVPSAAETAAPDPADPGAEPGEREYPVGIDCRPCHMGAGAQIADAGTVDQIPSLDSAQGGLGALCMACHNGWHAAGRSAEGELTSPHTSVQTDMFFGVNTVDPGTESTATAPAVQRSPHVDVEDTCVGCHVATTEGGTNHTFRVENFEGCEGQDCHDQDMTDGGQAEEDLDGDGNTETYALEIEGLTETLKTAIEAEAGPFVSARGQISFERGEPSDAAYAAAYNYFFVVRDGSGGAHNPDFTVDLLGRSIRAVGGTAPAPATP